jgi:hypothetical protein
MAASLAPAACLGTAGLVSRISTSSVSKLGTSLIGSSDERSAIRIVEIAVSRWCLMTTASGGICTYIADRVFKSARTPKTAAALARSLEQRKRTKWGDRLVLLVGLAKRVQQEYLAVTAATFSAD